MKACLNISLGNLKIFVAYILNSETTHGLFQSTSVLVILLILCVAESVIIIGFGLATRDSVTLPVSKKRDEPLIDDLSTLAPGWKVAVYPSGEVKKIKDDGYQHTDLDAAIEDIEAPEKVLELDDDEEMSDAEIDEKKTAGAKTSRKAPKNAKKTKRTTEASDVEDETKSLDKSEKISKKKKAKAADDSSEDEGDALEEEYMKELDILEGEIVGANADGDEGDDAEDDVEEAVEEEEEKADSKPKQIKKKTLKKMNIKKKAKRA